MASAMTPNELALLRASVKARLERSSDSGAAAAPAYAPLTPADSKALARHRHGSGAIEDRLMADGQARDARRHHMAESAVHSKRAAVDAEADALTFTPAVHSPDVAHIRQDSGVVDRNLQWMEDKNRRAEQKRALKQQEEVRDVRSVPAINARSARLVGDRTALQASNDLYADASRQREQLAARREDAYRKEVLAYPAITRRAAELVRDEDIGDRLYAHARDLAQRREAASASGTGGPGLGSGRGGRPALGTRPSPHARPRGRRPRRGSDPGMRSPTHTWGSSMVRGDLYDRAMAMKKRHEERKKQLEQEEHRATKPTLCEKSLKIAAGLKTKPMERLYQRPTTPPARPRNIVTSHEALGFLSSTRSPRDPGTPSSTKSGRRRHKAKSLSPQRSFRSKAGAGSVGAGAGAGAGAGDGADADADEAAKHEKALKCTNTHVERLYREGTVRVAKRRVVQPKQDEEEARECTFKPQIHPAAKALAPQSSDSIYQRGRTWVAKREVKLLRKRVGRVGEELSACTFVPDTGHSSKSFTRTIATAPVPPSHAQVPTPMSDSRSVMTVEDVHPGVNEFLERQRKARELAHSRRTTPFADGSKWTGKVTKPEEFKFAHRGKSGNIKSLRRPAPAETAAAAAAAAASVPSPVSRRVAPPPPVPAPAPAPARGGAHIRDMYADEVRRALQATGDAM